MVYFNNTPKLIQWHIDLKTMMKNDFDERRYKAIVDKKNKGRDFLMD